MCFHFDFDLSNHMGSMVARILGAVAQGEVEHKAERQRSANRQRAAEGKAWGAGVRRFGYDPDGVTIRPEEAAVVRMMVDHILKKGGSLRSLVQRLDDEGHRTSRGNKWNARSIVRLLLNPAMSGHRTYDDGDKEVKIKNPDGTERTVTVTKEEDPELFIVARDAWKGITTDEERRRLRLILKDPDRGTNTVGNSRRYLLSGGILICGLCGKQLSGHRANSGNPGYNCRKTPPYEGCGKIRIAAGPLELDVAGEVLARYASPAVRKRLNAALVPAGEVTLSVDLDELEAKLDQLGRDYADPEIPMDRATFVSASKSLHRQKNEIKAKLRMSERFAKLPDVVSPRSLAEWWADAEIEERRALILTVLDHIVVHPSQRVGFRGLDKERFTYVWR